MAPAWTCLESERSTAQKTKATTDRDTKDNREDITLVCMYIELVHVVLSLGERNTDWRKNELLFLSKDLLEDSALVRRSLLSSSPRPV